MRNWQAPEGLPQTTVNAMAQTADGYLWLGTQAGLVRFDGVRFQTMESGLPATIARGNVWDLQVDQQGDLWIGTMTGELTRMRAGVYTQVRGMPPFGVTDLWEDAAGAMWVAMLGGGVVRVVDDVAQRVREGSAGERAVAVDGDGLGRPVVASTTGLAMYVDGQWLPVSLNGMPDGNVLTGLAIIDGVWWLGTNLGLYRRETHTWSRQFPGNRSKPGGSTSVHATSGGDLIAGDMNGVWRLTRKGWRSEPLLQADARSFSWLDDQEGNAWVGTQLRGLFRITPNSVRMLGLDQGLSNEVVTAMLHARDGTTWIGTRNGLNQWKDGAFRQYAVDTATNVVRSLYEDHDGTIRVGTTRGLHSVVADRIVRFPGPLGDPLTSVTSSYRDERGHYWIGTRDGLYRQIGTDLVKYTTADGLADNWINTIEPGDPGVLWLGTPHGLTRLQMDTGQFAVDAVAAGLTVLSLHRDSRDGGLWIAPYNHGLMRLRRGELTILDSSNGLPSDSVFEVLEGGQDALWVTGEQGILQLSTADVDALAAGRIATVPVRRFDEADGMATRECVGGGSTPGKNRRADGTLWFATSRGIAVIDPVRIVSNTRAPMTLIEQFRAEHADLPLRTGLSLPAGSRSLELHYTATSLSASERNRFRFRLIGFDDTWVDAGSRRVAYYSALPPGEFRFEVMGSNNLGVWSDQPAQMEFRVLPFFYQRPWFIAVCALLLMALGVAAHQLRVGALRARNATLKERARLSQELHDMLSQTMTGILLQLDTARQALDVDTRAGRPYLERAVQLAREGLIQTRRTLRGLPPEELGGELDLASVLAQNIERLVAGTEISVTVRTRGKPRPLAAETELELYRIGQEAATNALRHAAARHIELNLHFEAHSLHFRLCDDGCGFNPDAIDAAQPGMGLRGMRARVDRLGASLQIQSRPGAGTCIDVHIPLPEETH